MVPVAGNGISAEASDVLHELAHISVADSGSPSWHLIAHAYRGATVFYRAEQNIVGKVVHHGTILEGARPSAEGSDFGTVAFSR
jgi:hypothetical protein